MKPNEVFVAADNIVSPLGMGTSNNFSALKAGKTGVRLHERPEMSEHPFYASLFGPQTYRNGGRHRYSKFEYMLIASIEDALRTSDVKPQDKRTVLIVCSTKGNIHLLDDEPGSSNAMLSLPGSATLLADHFSFARQPIIVSNACISGLLGMITGMRLIRAGLFENAVVTGADVISRFILSGFDSFQALSPTHCKPFDKDRNGINLGEGAATIVLSSRAEFNSGLRLRGGSIGNDANHISGPSRTGQELCQVIGKSLEDAGCKRGEIDFISAHGTATLYNDEMEAKAITLAGLQTVPVNSLKGYYGHTLGAAGLIESIVTLQSMREDLVLPSMGFGDNGVTTPLNVCSSLLHASLNTCLKTASGFGGCNAAVVMSK
jgi:3-oxoacyl-[acyl-carrier-protein] synthase I